MYAFSISLALQVWKVCDSWNWSLNIFINIITLILDCNEFLYVLTRCFPVSPIWTSKKSQSFLLPPETHQCVYQETYLNVNVCKSCPKPRQIRSEYEKLDLSFWETSSSHIEILYYLFSFIFVGQSVFMDFSINCQILGICFSIIAPEPLILWKNRAL